MSQRRNNSGRRRQLELALLYPISVVVPVRNGAATLGRCLEAILENDLEQLEILLVDDASTDETKAVAANYSSQVQMIARSRAGGPAAARNDGVGQARNPFLLFVDADVIIPSRTVEWLRESLELYSHRPEVVGVLGQYSETIPWPEFSSQYKNLQTCYLFRSTETVSPYLHTSIFCIRKDVLLENGGFDASLLRAEDFSLSLSLTRKGYRYVIDRRVEGIHLKRYSLLGILREDRRRIRDLRSLNLRPEERRLALRAHRPARLVSVVVSLPILAILPVTAVVPSLLPVVISLLLVFLIANAPFLAYLARRRGIGFAVNSLVLLLAEMAWAQLVLIESMVHPSRSHAGPSLGDPD